MITEQVPNRAENHLLHERGYYITDNLSLTMIYNLM